MAELIPPYLIIFIAGCFVLLATMALYVGIHGFIHKKYFGVTQTPLNEEAYKEAPRYIRDKYVNNHELFTRQMKTTFFQAILGFIMICLMFAWSAFMETKVRWIDISYKIGLIINGISILFSIHYNNSSKSTTIVLSFTASMYLFFAGAYIGRYEFMNAFSGLLLYLIMIGNYHFINKKRIQRDLLKEMEKNGFKINVKITSHDIN